MVNCQVCSKPFHESFGVCPVCGFVLGEKPKQSYHLHPGMMLRQRYVVGTAVGFGGFGITYRAWDKTLDKMAAVKEFYPHGIVNRIPGEKQVLMDPGKQRDGFQKGKARFLTEARNMAKFNGHPNLVSIYEFFEENNTAYIVMEFLEGISYGKYIADNGGKVDSRTAVKVILSVLDALQEIHKEKIVHRDISPDNIFLIPAINGAGGYRVKLIDFGAARFSSGDEEKTLSVILKPGYAPPEQYRSRGRQGPWTDIYAAGAVLYRSIVGQMPEESVNRMAADRLKPPADVICGLPRYLNDTIMRAMALNQELRFSNVRQFKEALLQKTKVVSVDREQKRRKTIWGIGIAGACLGLLTTACWGIFMYKRQALYDVEADIAIWMADVNGEKMEQIRQAARFYGGSEENRRLILEDSKSMMSRMTAEFTGKFEQVGLEQKIGGWDGDISGQSYASECNRAAIEGDFLPAVLDTSGITLDDGKLWERLGTLKAVYGALNGDDYYFLGDEAFIEEFGRRRQMKQIPISFRAPVLYVNTYLIDDWESRKLEQLTSLDALSLEGVKSFCVSQEDLGMYRDAFGDECLEAEGKMGYEPFLKREKAFYLGSTDDYEAVRVCMGGIYRMVVLEKLQKEGKAKGSFTHFWSISSSLDEEERTAADSLVYYLMGESAQDVFSLQNGNGLPLNKNMLQTYVKANDEFANVVSQLQYLKMQEYGEGSKK